MHYGDKAIFTKYRCDVPMRRSKEKCYISSGENAQKWECSGNCMACFCCLIKLKDGTEEHIDPMRKNKMYEYSIYR